MTDRHYFPDPDVSGPTIVPPPRRGRCRCRGTGLVRCGCSDREPCWHCEDARWVPCPAGCPVPPPYEADPEADPNGRASSVEGEDREARSSPGDAVATGGGLETAAAPSSAPDERRCTRAEPCEGRARMDGALSPERGSWSLLRRGVDRWGSWGLYDGAGRFVLSVDYCPLCGGALGGEP